jgi:putative membrane protein
MPFDPGLQPERTRLAWRRTALSMVVAGLLAPRALYDAIGGFAVATGLVGAATGVALTMAAARRARRVLHVLLSGAGLLPDGRLLLAVALLVASGSGIALVGVVLQALAD